MNKKIFIHGGSSLISKFLIKKFKHETSEFYIFCRDIKKTKSIIGNENLTESKFYFFENNLENLKETFEDLNKIPNELDGIFWVTGFTGDAQEELNSIEKARLNLKINFTNVVLCLSFLIKKMTISKQSFICVITSVAGLRGRGKNFIYGSAKAGLIAYLSGLRQKYNQRLTVISVIPGYVRTNNFKLVDNFLKNDIDELYDLINDPGEMNNLINDKDYDHIEKELRNEAKRLQEKYKYNPDRDWWLKTQIKK